MRQKSFYIIVSLFSLVFGGLIYALFRKNSIIAIFLHKYICLDTLKINFSNLDSVFIKYYFIDFLWALSFICGLQAIVFPQNRIYITSALVIITGVFWEVLQYLNILPGTGDFLDCLMYLTAVLTVVLINNFLKEKKL